MFHCGVKEMRIILDAYFDNNFGDDYFISTILRRYPNDIFYSVVNNKVASVWEKISAYPNLVMLPSNCELAVGGYFDGYIMVGGDVLPDGVDYSFRMNMMRNVKQCGGFVAMLGFSMYQTYGDKTREDLKTMASLADVIVSRDKFSAERFSALVPGANVTASTDMAFTGAYEVCVHGDNILGIAPRRKLYSTEEQHTAYCSAMASVADNWLDKRESGTVRFLAFSNGEYDDQVTITDIRSKMKYSEKAEVVSPSDNMDDFLLALKTCDAMIPTRFHALVFALIYGIPFVPVPYETKVTQLLDELNYSGIRIPYGEGITAETARAAVDALQNFDVDRDKLEAYKIKAECFFTELDRFVAAKRLLTNRTGKCQVHVCSKVAENERLALENAQYQRDNAYLTAQVKELEKWVQSLQQERKLFAEALQETQNSYEELSGRHGGVIANRIKKALFSTLFDDK